MKSLKAVDLNKLLHKLAVTSLTMSHTVGLEPAQAIGYCSHTMSVFCNILGTGRDPIILEAFLRAINKGMVEVYGLRVKFEKDDTGDAIAAVDK